METTKNLSVVKKVIFTLALGWTILIAFLCLARFSDLPSLGISNEDKYVHFTFHFVFTLLWGFNYTLYSKRIRILKIVNIVVASLFFGILIEVLQELYTTTRHADIMDVLANLTGATVALGVFILIKISKKNKKRRKVRKTRI